MNRKVYLVTLCPNPNHILPIPGQWSCDQPLKFQGDWSRHLGGAALHTDRQNGRMTDRPTDRLSMNNSKGELICLFPCMCVSVSLPICLCVHLLVRQYVWAKTREPVDRMSSIFQRTPVDHINILAKSHWQDLFL